MAGKEEGRDCSPVPERKGSLWIDPIHSSNAIGASSARRPRRVSSILLELKQARWLSSPVFVGTYRNQHVSEGIRYDGPDHLRCKNRNRSGQIALAKSFKEMPGLWPTRAKLGF